MEEPQPPDPGECCGSGCSPCVWDLYYQAYTFCNPCNTLTHLSKKLEKYNAWKEQQLIDEFERESDDEDIPSNNKSTTTPTETSLPQDIPPSTDAVPNSPTPNSEGSSSTPTTTNTVLAEEPINSNVSALVEHKNWAWFAIAAPLCTLVLAVSIGIYFNTKK